MPPSVPDDPAAVADLIGGVEQHGDVDPTRLHVARDSSASAAASVAAGDGVTTAAVASVFDVDAAAERIERLLERRRERATEASA